MKKNRPPEPDSNTEIGTQHRELDAAASLHFVGLMLRDLRAMAATADAGTLVYLIDMAIIEAADQAHRKSARPA